MLRGQRRDAALLQRLLQSAEMRRSLGAHARRHVEAHHNQSVVIDRICAIYATVLRRMEAAE